MVVAFMVKALEKRCEGMEMAGNLGWGIFEGMVKWVRWSF
jgi:hypothetical protein